MPRPSPTPAQVDLAVSYYHQGKTVGEIADILGFHNYTMRRYLRDRGLRLGNSTAPGKRTYRFGDCGTQEKWCARCEAYYPTSAFYSAGPRRGLASECKDCDSERSAERYARRSEAKS